MFKVQDKWLLICSPCGNNVEGDGYDNQPIIQPVDFDTLSAKVSIEGEYQYLDYGLDLYAPQTNLDKAGNRVVIAWARMACPMASADNPASDGMIWNGMMSIPRIIEIRDGVIYTIPHENIRKYFASNKCVSKTESKITRRFDDTKTQITTSIAEGEYLTINGYKISLIDGQVVGDRSGTVPDGIDIHKISRTPYVGEEAQLEIYYDSDFIEIFVDGGKYVLSHVTYINAQNV